MLQQIERITPKTDSRVWFIRFDEVLMANNWDIETQSKMIPAFLDDKLLQAFANSKAFAEMPSGKKFKLTREWIIQNTTSVGDPSISFQAFSEAVPWPTQKVSEFFMELERLLHSSMPNLGEGEKDFLIKQKIVGSVSLQISSHLRILGDLNINDLCQKADILLSANPTCSVSEFTNQEPTVAVVNKLLLKNNDIDMRLAKIEAVLDNLSLSRKVNPQSCQKCGSYGHHTSECLGKALCNFCGNTGHLKQICPNIKTFKSNPYSKEYYSSSLFNMPKLNFAIVPMVIDKKYTHHALIDTGSCICLIKKSILHKKVAIKECELKVFSVTNAKLTVIGKCNLNIQVANIYTNWEFIVAEEIHYDVIIGKDFIQSHNMTINLNNVGSILGFSNIKSCSVANLTGKLLNDILYKFDHAFAKSENDFGHTKLVKHKITTETNKPQCSRPYRVPRHIQNDIETQIKKMLLNKIIQPSNSPWSAPIVVAKKKDGSNRICVDFRKLNAQTRRDQYSLSVREDLYDK